MQTQSVLRRLRSGGRSKAAATEDILVLGLGRFGMAIADELRKMGHEVLGVDADAQVVQRAARVITHAVQADTTDVDALSQIGAGEFSHAVVAIGDIEASVLTVIRLIDLGLYSIWAKAATADHRRILERVGAHHVVQPEQDMGERLAHLVTGRMIDYLEIDPGFALVETEPPQALLGQSLSSLRLRDEFGITVVCVKSPGESFTYARPDTTLEPGDIILIAGPSTAVAAFSNEE
ncbi:MAG: TrkA family potassium uptake protein [Actinobacteria bacterium]|nr:TrkA family potassium uptake protein [Actinomycetota bacterium]MCB9388692.1 TrkA family potassium uptake protein [Acidimicrobiia bacterium]